MFVCSFSNCRVVFFVERTHRRCPGCGTPGKELSEDSATNVIQLARYVDKHE